MRIFVACADERLRMALLLLIDNEPGMLVVGITDRLAGLLEQVQASQPDIILFSWETPAKKVFDLLSGFHNLEGHPEVIYLSNREDQEEQILATGADHFIPMNVPPDRLLYILRNPKQPETKV